MIKAAEFELMEMLKFYGSIVGTEGVSQPIQEKCNINIARILESLEPKLTELLAESAGLITK